MGMNSEYQTNLEKAFGFTEADLYDNRQGRLSAAQIARMRGHSTRLFLAVVGFLALITVPSFILSGADPGELGVVLACTLLPIVAVTFAFTMGVTESALSARAVSKLSGQIHLAYGLMSYVPPLDYDQVRVARTLIVGRTASYRMVVNNREFRLHRDEYEAFTAGVYYSIYFVPTLNKIVGVQRIDPDFKEPLDKPDIIVTALPPGDDTEEVRA